MTMEAMVDDQVTLSAYTEEIRTLIQTERSDQALPLCQHVLRYYPKHVDTYRQMAEASLERGDLDGARELFGRVLSADPENVIAYAGMAIIFERQNLTDEALWHLERAYELSPADLELRKELLRLYGEIEGKARARLKLTPGALARLYVQEGLFPQAVQEFRAIASHSPKRFDARVGLAETLWRSGQLREAADVSQAILNNLPFCLKANLILGTVWQESGLKEGENFLNTATLLDPLNRVAQDLLGPRSPLRPGDALVPRFVEGVTPAPEPEPQVELAEPSPTDWFATLPPIAEESQTPTTELREEISPIAETAIAEEPPFAPLAEIPATEPAPIAEEPPVAPPAFETFLAEPPAVFEPRPESPPIQPAPSVSLEEAPIEIPPRELITPKPPAVSSDLPPWLRADMRAAARVNQPPRRVTPKPTAAIPSSLPPWLTELQRTLSDTAAPRAEPVEKKVEPPPTPMPAWLTDQPKTEQAEIISEEPRPPTEEIVAPSWATSVPPPPTESPAQPEARVETPETEELPQWLTDLRGGFTAQQAPAAEEPAVETQVPAEETQAELPDWIQEAMTGEQKPAEMQSAAEVASEPVVEPQAEMLFEREEQPSTAEEPTELFARETVPVMPLPEPSLEFAEEEPKVAEVETAIPAAVQPEVVPQPSQPPETIPPPVRRRREPKGSAQLAQARDHRDANRLEEALVEYDFCVQHAPRLVNQVIGDLAELVERPGVPLDAHRILGDAYTRADRLGEALERYRFVLDRVS
ncbi:MAG: tetratricopeptide repeat protein [Chloroflexi bacterium]|nr:tetratricopeptide repeat protein [Chloroflexota bacterium]